MHRWRAVDDELEVVLIQTLDPKTGVSANRLNNAASDWLQCVANPQVPESKRWLFIHDLSLGHIVATSPRLHTINSLYSTLTFYGLDLHSVSELFL